MNVSFEFWVIWIAGIIGTSLMTLFSILIGKILSKDFSEPKLLAELLQRYRHRKKNNYFNGWVTHYLIGVFFSWSIFFYVKISDSEYTYFVGLISGIIMGVFGVLGWSTMMKFVKNPPKLDIPIYFVQLVFAHVVFSISALSVFRLLL